MDGVFAVYGRLGFEHILDPQGYDHILFLATLCAVYTLVRWRELLVLVTAFTVGHSVSLALATLDLVRADSTWVEFLIPVTIVLTAVVNVVLPPEDDTGLDDGKASRLLFTKERLAKYALVLAFGLIHGLGFSNFLRIALGEERSLLVPLLGFNVGLEVGQVLIALAVLAVGFVASRIGLKERYWAIGLSTVAGLVALKMAVERIPF